MEYCLLGNTKIDMKPKIILPDKVCPNCHKAFNRNLNKSIGDFRKRKFCSHKCSSDYYSGERHAKYKSIKDKIEGNIEISTNGCWNWVGTKRGQSSGVYYGGTNIGRKSMLAHRASYELYIDKIPEGMLVCHKCDNPRCVNPEHLFLGTHLDNGRDMSQKNRGTNGEKSANSKLTSNQVMEIRFAGKLRNMRQKDIAYVFGVSEKAVHKIINNKTWKHLL